MKWKCESVHSHPLQPAANRQAFDLHLAALDWSLVDPIIINSPDDIKATNWRDTGLKPFTHQIHNLMTFCRRLPVALIADDVGLGKTISAGLILSELISRHRVKRALVICPKVLTEQWVTELADHFRLPAIAATGVELDKALRGQVPIVVTTYDSVRDRLNKIEGLSFDMCILDEAHKLRNLHGTSKAPAVALRIKEALKKSLFKYVLMLTATPIQNKIWDLYSLIDLLKVAEGKPNPLGDEQLFEATYLRPRSSGRQLRSDREVGFRRIVRDCMHRTRRRDVDLGFPERRIERVLVPLSMAEQDIQKTVGRYIAKLSGFVQTNLAQTMMSSPQALLAMAENMLAKESLPAQALDDLRSAAARVTIPTKLQQLKKLITDLRQNRGANWRLVVFTVRLETQAMIRDELVNEGISVGLIRGGQAGANSTSIKRYRHDPPLDNVLVSTDAGAEGINLQAGNVLVNYDLPWNPMVLEQRIGRVQRLGSQFQYVTIINLVGRGTVEERIVARLVEKLQGVAQAIGDIEGILDAAGMDDDDEQTSFEARLRKLVVDSLQGINVSAQEELLAKNIDEANRLFEEQRATIDSTLGSANDRPQPTYSVPKLERRPPRLTYRDLVCATKEADGFALRPIDEEVLEVTKAGHVPEKICFTDNANVGGVMPIFADQGARVYYPGKPAFERLVQHWVDHHSHVVGDRANFDEADITALLAQWQQHWPDCRIVSHNLTLHKERQFCGSVHVKVRAVTGVDSYEKILQTTFGPPQPATATPAPNVERIIEDPIALGEVFPQFETQIASEIERDVEVGRFCDYYTKRLDEAFQQVGLDPQRHHKMQADFQPYVQGEVYALDGFSYHPGTLTISFTVEQQQYTTTIEIIPYLRTMTSALEFGECVLTKQLWPSECLAPCAVTGSTALRHRLVTTASGSVVLPSEAVTCAISGDVIERRQAGVSAMSGKVVDQKFLHPCAISSDLVLEEELATSAISGQRFRSDRAVVSALSGRIGTPSEAVTCAATQRLLLLDEATPSQRTGQHYGTDQLQPCALSGKHFPPSDLEVCDETGDRVHFKHIGVCEITQRRVRADRLVCSPVSGKVFIASVGVLTNNGQVALPDEVVMCAASGRKLLITEAVQSATTKEYFDREQLVACAVTGQRVPPPDLELCEESQTRVLPSALATCPLSGKRVRIDCMVQSPISGVSFAPSVGVLTDGGQLAMPNEVVTCASSGKRLLVTEAIRSKRTGEYFANDQLARCAATGQYAPPPDLIRCEETNTVVLPTELVRCLHAQKIVRRDVVVRSPVSGKRFAPSVGVQTYDGHLVLPDEAVVCAATGRVVLRRNAVPSATTGAYYAVDQLRPSAVSGGAYPPPDLRLCQESQTWVLPKELGVCAVSNIDVRRDLMLQSPVSQVWFAPSQGEKTFDGQLAAPQDIAVCYWQRRKYLRTAIERCTMSEVEVHRRFINAFGELTAFRYLLDGTSIGQALTDPALIALIVEAVGWTTLQLSSITKIDGPTGMIMALCAEERSRFGLRVRYHGAIVKQKDDRVKLLGRTVSGVRRQARFYIE